MVLFLFFCSGATALIYEVIWSKHLSLMFGSTVWAQTVVLAAFMGGLALGNRFIGARSDLLRRPLASYGYLEIGIGLYAFCFTALYQFADTVFVALGSRLLEQAFWLLVLKGILSAVLLLIPTIMMGGTLPLVAAWLHKTSSDAGRNSARFYSVNSLGAVAGSFLAGFFLVQWIGLHAALQLTALGNALIGGAAILLSSRESTEPESAGTKGASLDETPAQRQLLRRGCCIVALTGAVSMGLEVLAARGLALIFGSSLQAFAIVLMAFILGIGLGSAVMASKGWKASRNETAIFVLLLGAATWICLFIMNIEGLVEFYRRLRTGLAPTTMGYRYHQGLAGLISLVVLGVPAGFLGAVLPLWIRSVAGEATHLGSQVGRLLTWNTCGAVIGVLLTGFVLMPVAGLRGASGTLAAVLSVAALILVLPGKNVRRIVVAAGVFVLALVAGFQGGDGWRYVLSSGVFRSRAQEVEGNPILERHRFLRLLFYEDAPDATVSVEQSVQRTNLFTLRINGKPDASSGGDMSAQYLCAHLPLAARPDAKDVFVLGFGSGVTAGALLGHPVENIVIAENCEPVLKAEKFFRPWNHGVMTNSRARIMREDARTILKLSPQLYDVIICEPSNPWTVGVGSVFSREFYELASSRLKTNGVICQWFHVYEMHDGIVFLVLRTFGTMFPHFEIWEASEGDILMIGSHRPFHLDAGHVREILARPEPRQELEGLGLGSPEAFFARQLASQRTAYAIPGDGVIQTDGFPVLEYEAPKAFFLGRNATVLFDFDERTWQHDLAPDEKQRLLRNIQEPVLRGVFGNISPGNPQLTSYLVMRLRGGGPGTAYQIGNDFLPTIFSTNQLPPPMLPADADDKMRLLMDGFLTLNTTNSAEGVKQMVAALNRPDWTSGAAATASHYAARAVKKCLWANDVESARVLLKLGLTSNPTSGQLKYLTRILEREGVITAEELRVLLSSGGPGR